mgnify:CR=1 FL=1
MVLQLFKSSCGEEQKAPAAAPVIAFHGSGRAA